ALPFALTVGNHAKCYGLNKVGVRRRGHARETIAALHHAFHLLLSSKLNTAQAIGRIREEIKDTPEVDELVRFVESPQRGVVKSAVATLSPAQSPTANTQHPVPKLGLIAGNGRFPFLVIEGAHRAGAEVAVAAIREETDPAIEKIADRLTWVGIGQLGKMLRFFKDEGVDKAIMAGQVKHVQIFSKAIPDVRMLKMLLRLPRRNTDALIGAVANELASEGIELIDSTFFLQDQLPRTGTLTRREPDERERSDIEYGLEI